MKSWQSVISTQSVFLRSCSLKPIGPGGRDKRDSPFCTEFAVSLSPSLGLNFSHFLDLQPHLSGSFHQPTSASNVNSWPKRWMRDMILTRKQNYTIYKNTSTSLYGKTHIRTQTLRNPKAKCHPLHALLQTLLYYGETTRGHKLQYRSAVNFNRIHGGQRFILHQSLQLYIQEILINQS